MSPNNYLAFSLLFLLLTSEPAVIRKQDKPNTAPAQAQTKLPEPMQAEIFAAIKASDLTKLRKLLDEGLNPNSLILGSSAPMISSAAHGGWTDVVRLLLQYKADPNSVGVGFFKIPALYSAADNGFTEIVSLLLKAGARADEKFTTATADASKEGRTPLMAAVLAKQTNLDVIKLLVAAGAIDATDASGTSATAMASFTGNAEAVRLLIAAKADVNLRNKEAMTPLLLAALNSNNSAVVKLLVVAGADVNAKAKTGNTPLTTAAIAGSTETALALIDAGADVNATDNEGHTALMSAVNGDLSLVKKLIAAKANVNVRSKPPEDITAISLASQMNRAEAVQLLIAAGADVNMPVSSGSETPLALAELGGHKEVGAMLTKAGAKSMCPILQTSCPEPSIKIGSQLIIQAKLVGGDGEVTPTYNWSVSAGSILSGQGTSSIEVDSTAVGSNTKITATVDVGGYPRRCPVVHSCSVELLR